MLQAHHESGEQFSLVLTDDGMPDMDGFPLPGEIRKINVAVAQPS